MRTSEGISERQRAILSYIEDFVQQRGYSPAIRDIQQKLGISSTSVVQYNLQKLQDKGLLNRHTKISRAITIPGMSNVSDRLRGGSVPLLGIITAGVPLVDPEEVPREGAELIEVPIGVADPDKLNDVYALKVRGHSMIDALIDDGDIVLLRSQETAENGQMVAVRIQQENGVTLKRFYREGERVRLQPANITMAPIFVNAADVSIQGRVVGVMRSMV